MKAEIFVNNGMLDLFDPATSLQEWKEKLTTRGVALRLGRRYRFAAATDWTVLHHSILCSSLAYQNGCDNDTIMACAWHDSAEAFLGDIPAPWKENMFAYKGGSGVAVELAEIELNLRDAMKNNIGLRFCENGNKVGVLDRIAFEMEVMGLFDKGVWGYFGVKNKVDIDILSVIQGMYLRKNWELEHIFTCIFENLPSVKPKLEAISKAFSSF
jgi:hypothetical protein